MIHKGRKIKNKKDFIKSADEWGAGGRISLESYPYSLKDESDRFKEKFDQLFEPIQEKVDKESRQVLLFKEQFFFSNAENAVLTISQERARAKQWLAMLQNNGGIKAAEDRWLGLTEWLENYPERTLTKSDVLQFINVNKIEVNEVLLSNEKSFKLEWKQIVSSEFNYYETEHAGITYIITPSNQEFRILDLDGIELGSCKSLDAAQSYLEQLVRASPTDITRNADWTTPGIDNLKTLVLSTPNIEGWNQEDLTHYGDIADGKAIAWVRFGDVVDESGRKILLVDEIQSKRHQEGRQFGYRTPATDAEFQTKQKFYTALKSELSVKYGADIDEPSISCLSNDDRVRLSRAYDDMNIEKYISRVPEAPFEKQWHELVFKRMLRYAAENGYDTLAWTTGEHQSERYGFSPKWDAIEFNPCNKEGFPGIITLRIPNETPQNKYVSNETELSRLVGQEIAEKITQRNYRLAGKDLNPEFIGMKGFYDIILVSFANHYAKKWDAQVYTLNLPLGEKGHALVHTIDVTEGMCKSLFEGQPLFTEINNSEHIANKETQNLVRNLITELAKKTHIPVNIVQRIEFLPPHLLRALNRKKILSRDPNLRLPGVYDPETEMVHFVLNELHSETEASRLFLHEVIAHKGIEGLLGKNRARAFYGQVFNSLDRATQEQLMRKYHNKFVAGAEYVALVAEENKKPSVIERIISFFRDILRSMGISLEIKNEDIRTLLASSRKYLQAQQMVKMGEKTQQNTELRRTTTEQIPGVKTNVNSRPKLTV